MFGNLKPPMIALVMLGKGKLSVFGDGPHSYRVLP